MSITLSPDEHLIALLDRIADRDEAALRELYDITSRKLYGLALKMVGRVDLAEDVLQECYLNVWRIASDYRASLSPPLGWMSVIVRSRALDMLRRLSSQMDGKMQSLDDDESQQIASSEVGLLDAAMAGEQAGALNNCLSKIEAKQRDVIVWAYFRDMSHSELASQFDLPIGTIKTWIRRGLAQLKSCMASFA
jgi:RNA polymerase sigma-70 factor (ECF subfamily)